MKEEREKVFGEIISIFNDTHRMYGGRGCWQCKWHTLESLEELRNGNKV